MKKRIIKIIIIILLIILVLVLIAIVTLFIEGGVLVKAKYLEPWQKTYSQQFSDSRVQLISHGLLAANGHNMQPWKIKLDKSDNNVFYLYADAERLTKEVDPLSRQTMITQGTFLEYVRVAGEKIGFRTDFVFFPDGEYDETRLEDSMRNKPVAKIILNKLEQKHTLLYDYMFMPDTNRSAYKKEQLALDQINKIININSDEDIVIKTFQDEKNLVKLGNYVIEGAKIESSIHRMNTESANVFRINEKQKNEYRCGYSVEGQGIKGINKYFIQGLITLFPSATDEKASADLYVKSTKTAVENTPCYVMVITKDNNRLQQVKAGMIYSRLVLTAHSLGLAMQPPSQVLEEYPEMKEQYSKIHNEYASEGGTIQMLFRIGKPTQEFPQSMRRDVMDLIVKN